MRAAKTEFDKSRDRRLMRFARDTNLEFEEIVEDGKVVGTSIVGKNQTSGQKKVTEQKALEYGVELGKWTRNADGTWDISEEPFSMEFDAWVKHGQAARTPRGAKPPAALKHAAINTAITKQYPNAFQEADGNWYLRKGGKKYRINPRQ